VKVDGKNKTVPFYNASSPDELALVNGARYLGFEFFERDAENNLCIHINNFDDKVTNDGIDNVKKYNLLNVIEFDSARKRMSVIVKTEEGKYVIFTKGADSIIEKRLEAT
jgi:phospholipid-translocating ATPase